LRFRERRAWERERRALAVEGMILER